MDQSTEKQDDSQKRSPMIASEEIVYGMNLLELADSLSIAADSDSAARLMAVFEHDGPLRWIQNHPLLAEVRVAANDDGAGFLCHVFAALYKRVLSGMR